MNGINVSGHWFVRLVVNNGRGHRWGEVLNGEGAVIGSASDSGGDGAAFNVKVVGMATPKLVEMEKLDFVQQEVAP